MLSSRSLRFLPVLVALLALAVAVSWATNAQAVWVKETVASAGDQGQYATIALDSSNTPHIAWYDASNAQLYYASRDWDGWDITLIESGQVGEWASIDINPITDYPAIAYFDANNEAAKYAWYDGSDWHTEFISNGGTLRGDYIRLRFRVDGVPFVSYHYDNEAFAYMGVTVSWRTGDATWEGHNVDEAIWPFDMGAHTALAFDSANYPQVAYRDQTLGYQKFGYQNGSGWFFETAVDFDQAGEWASIAVDSGDNIYISSFNTETIGDECVCIISKVAGDWSMDDVDCGSGDYGMYSSLVVDDNDYLHLTYYAAGVLNYAVETADLDGWDIQTLDDTADTGKFTGLALDTYGSPFVVYYNATAKDLQFIYDQPLPTVASITPNTGLNDAALTGVVVAGEFFLIGSTVKLVSEAGDAEILATNVTVDSQEQITCDIDLTGAAVGLYDVVVTTSAGAGTLADGFTVTTNPPELTAIDPDSGPNDDASFTISLDGANFTPTMTATLTRTGHTPREAESVTVGSATAADAVFDLKNLDPGLWTVKITTEFGEAELADAFEVTCGAPIAAFAGLPRSGEAPLTVNFTSTSVDYTGCDITTYEWDFGDGGTSTEESPAYVYQTAGTYAVSLTVTSPGGSDTENKAAYIEVTVTVDDDTTDDDTTIDDDITDDDETDDDSDDDIVLPDDDTSSSGDDDDDSGGCGC